MSRRAAFNAGCVLIGLVLWAVWVQPLWKRAMNGENDFLQLYFGASHVGTPELFDVEANIAYQKTVTEEKTYYPGVYYTRLPFYAVLLSPLAKFPFHTAYWIWQAFNLALVGAFLYVYSRRWQETVVLASLSLALLINFCNAQDAGIVTAIAGFAVLLMERRRDFLAGLLFSLCAIKFHLFLLVPVVLAVHRRWGVLKGGAAGGAALLAISFAGAGLDWPARFLAFLKTPTLHLAPERMPTFRNWAWWIFGRENILFEAALAACVAGLVAWLAWRIPDIRIAMGLALTGGLVIAHHAYSQDQLLVLLAAALFGMAGASTWLTGAAIVYSLPSTTLILFHDPVSRVVPLMLIGVLLAGLKDAYAHRPPGAPAGH